MYSYVMSRLFEHASEKRIPISSTLEIIDECNLRCVHCYVEDAERKNEMLLDDAISFIEQIKRARGMYLTITGGEPLLHKNFESIYTFACKKGLSVSVFTNGSLLTKQHVQLFEANKPRLVEITLYGFSENTYERVTGRRAFRAVINAVNMLKSCKIPLLIKYFVLRDNIDDFKYVIKYCRENQFPLKVDSIILAPADSEKVKHQISSNDMKIVKEQMSFIQQFHKQGFDIEYKEYIEGRRQDENLLNCGAGLISCWLKPDNRVVLCNFLPQYGIDLNQHTFEEAWKYLNDVRISSALKKSQNNSACQECKLQNHCKICPARNAVITGDIHCVDVAKIFCDFAEVDSQLE